VCFNSPPTRAEAKETWIYSYSHGVVLNELSIGTTLPCLKCALYSFIHRLHNGNVQIDTVWFYNEFTKFSKYVAFKVPNSGGHENMDVTPCSPLKILQDFTLLKVQNFARWRRFYFIFFLMPFYLKSLLVHSANCVKTCIQWHLEEFLLALFCN
jgi:hypothetical protein